MKKEDTSYNLQIDNPASLKGILLLFIDLTKVKAYSGLNKVFYNPKIGKTSIIVVSRTICTLYSHTMLPKDHFEQIDNLFGSHDSTVNIGQIEKYALFVDFLATSDYMLHGTGSYLQKITNDISLHISKKTDGMRNICCYAYLLSDA